MKKHLEIIPVLGLFLSFEVFSKVRTVRTNDQQIAQIRLKIGKSTLLSFPERPTKIVMGNPDFFTVEFVENDLSLNPKGIVETNLFVYTKQNVFAFLLRVASSGQYDDLVHVKYKPRYLYKSKSRISKFKKKEQSLKFDFERIEFVTKKKKLLIDFSLKNITNKKISLKRLAIKIFQEKRKLKIITFVLSPEDLKGRKKAKGKIVARFFKKGNIHLKVKLNDEKYH
ncbi:MAG: pilus assembly protein N-terminal domain-containing protein, partial [Halobacteriovoraceae bacterium]|nr:pilus assembly protein N-terminal domain-containing protein [Halobacteriovoraceae bacterium]